MKKRILALLLVAVMLLNAFPVYAAENPTFVVDTVTASAGDTVDVTISVKNNPGITSIKLSMEYDDALTFNSATINSDLGSNFLTSPEGKYPVILNWFDGLKNVTGDWIFVTLSFTVAEDAAEGTYPITITYDPNDVYNINEDNVTFDIEDGAIEVAPAEIAVTGVTLDKTTLSLTEGETATLTATVTPADATNKTVTFTSSNTSVATVDGSGKVTAVKEGTATITVTTADGGMTATCAVTVACAHTNKTEVPAKSADCVNSGNNLYYVCAACGQAFKADGVTKTTVEAETIASTGHSYTEKVEDEAHLVPGSGADCQSVKQYYYDCANCDSIGTTIWSSTTCGEHKPTLVAGYDATCTEAGQKDYYACACGKWFWDAAAAQEITDESAVVIDKLGHSFTNYVSDENATCVEDGTETAVCDRCDETDTRTISGSREDADHSFPVDYTSDGNATCTADGTKTRACTLCGEKETVTDEGSALGHSFTNYTSDGNATCTEDGTETAICDRCDETDTRTEADSALGHSYTAKTQDYPATSADCCHKATYYYSCANCGEQGTETFEYGDYDLTTHVGGTEIRNAVAATEESEGYTGDTYCLGCGTLLKQGETIAKLDHTHNMKKTEAVAATCTEAGNIAYWTCTKCGKLYADADGAVEITEADTVVTALGHSFTNYTSDGNATCTEDGTETAICDRCDETHTRTDSGSKLGHNYEDGTCTGCGAAEVMLGDVNFDGVINMFDAAKIVSHYTGKIQLTGNELIAADVNRDGVINMFDAAKIVSYYTGKIDSF